VSREEKHRKILKEFQFFAPGTRSDSVSFCYASSRQTELGFTSFSEKEHDIYPENKEFFSVLKSHE